MLSRSIPGEASLVHAAPRAAHVARQPVAPLGGKAAEGGSALLQILVRTEGRTRAGPGASAVMDEGRVDHRAAPARLAHGKGQVAVVPVQKPVALVEAPDLLEESPAEAEAHAVHHCDFRNVAVQRPRAVEGMNDGPTDIPAVPPNAIQFRPRLMA